MAKLRMKYRPPVEGRKIDVTAATYARLVTVAAENRCTIGQWCESNLAHRLRLQMNSPRPVSQPATGALAKVRQFEITEALYSGIERFAVKQGKAAQFWIACTILDCLRIEEVRLTGVVKEPDRFA